MHNLKVFFVLFHFLILGLQCEGMEGSIGPFDADGVRQSILMQLNSQDTPKGGVIGSRVFWRFYFSQIKEF